ncbi:MAG: isochorismatase family protein, partial [Hyphomicrobiaceae bacterium]
MLANRLRSHLLIVDMQEKPLARVGGGQRVLQNAMRLAGFARRLSVPITIGELEPSRYGTTSALLREVTAGEAALVGRTRFSCWRDQLLSARLRELRQSGRDQVVVCGLEAHVAVCQSTLDL